VYSVSLRKLLIPCNAKMTSFGYAAVTREPGRIRPGAEIFFRKSHAPTRTNQVCGESSQSPTKPTRPLPPLKRLLDLKPLFLADKNNEF